MYQFETAIEDVIVYQFETAIDDDICVDERKDMSEQ